ncbi:MAG TPA: excinuclease ABC subunit UvrC [Bacillota bacterium]|nr:excinuclease ABC subunit UvrC [Bacillota bacterium]
MEMERGSLSDKGIKGCSVLVIPEQLLEKVKQIPASPGVYLFKDAVGRVIYVGKAVSLRQRVRSYLADAATLPPKLKALQSQMRDIDYIVTGSEVEALILECNLIKEYRPRYNVYLRDDKDYPCLRLTGELYPRLEYLRLSQKEGRRGARRVEANKKKFGERFFGPYTNAGAVHETMRLLGKIFPLRRCRQPLTGEPSPHRPCLNYQMKRCLAPCRGSQAVSPEEYEAQVKQVALFLEGRQTELERDLEQKMQAAAERERYEEAARIRDQLLALRQVAARQQIVFNLKKTTDQDVLALVREGKEAAVHLFVIREGKLLNQEHFRLAGAAGESDDDALAAFIKSYYSRGGRPPKEIILSHPASEKELLQQWLKRTAGYRVNIIVPTRGDRKKLLDLAIRNGNLKLREELQRTWQREQLPLAELAELAGLKEEPARIEGYDISHLQGNEAVGSMVVFEQGRPHKESYRHFHLRRTPPGDDYAALQEVLRRRAGHNEWPLPDLILVDGGKGQLKAAREALDQAGLQALPVISLAKNPEQIFLEGAALPVILPAHSTLLQLLQRIRDEAHRFALDYHRRLRQQGSTFSALERIPGIGPKRKSALLQHFGSLEALLCASPEQIEAVPGFSKALAQTLYQHLHGGSV